METVGVVFFLLDVVGVIALVVLCICRKRKKKAALSSDTPVSVPGEVKGGEPHAR